MPRAASPRKWPIDGTARWSACGRARLCSGCSFRNPAAACLKSTMPRVSREGVSAFVHCTDEIAVLVATPA